VYDFVYGVRFLYKDLSNGCQQPIKAETFINERLAAFVYLQGGLIMATKTLDRRIQRTRQLIQNALLELILEKGYEAVTVQDVIDRANVGRSTFYVHFQDKEDLFFSEFETLRDQFDHHLMTQPVVSGAPWEVSLHMFQHAQSQHMLYRALAGKQSGSAMIAHFHKYLFSLLQEHLKSQFAGRNNLAVPIDVMANYLVSSFIALLTWWLDHDFPYPAERINEMYRMLIQPGFEAIFNNASTG
jgi:AcrR family transcriptional regulator